MAVESMPLAVGYLKATAEADPDLKREFDIRIHNFGGGHSTLSMVQRMFFDEVPDIVAFSVLGWNAQRFAAVAKTFSELNPKGLIIAGGTHWANQAKGVFGSFPWLDVIVNGEGEFVFAEILRAYAAGTSRHELDAIKGISFKRPDGEVVTTPAADRINDLNTIPSPFLSGAIRMVDDNGNFPYDVAIMETNRGCPYKCAFCYWGGAIGQKIRAFSIDRLREEVELFARYKVANIALCDANFGLLKQDAEFIDVVIKAREKYGFPKHVESSWAKNKGKVFFEIVRRMKRAGLHTSFTLALQSLSEPALELMQRQNMKVNEWEDLAEWLRREGMGLYAEIIWSVPGETYDSFLTGYDKLAKYVSRIAAYPILLMPNTQYSDNREEYGFVSMRGEKDDYEYVLAHKTMTFEDNRRMHRFLFWARVIGEYMFLRHIWLPARNLLGLTQSQILLSLNAWLDRQENKITRGLQACRSEVVNHLDASRVTRGIHYLAVEPAVGPLIQRWWEEEILPKAPPELRGFFASLLQYDLATRPMYSPPDGKGWTPQSRVYVQKEELEVEEIDHEMYLVRRAVELDYPVPAILAEMLQGKEPTIEPGTTKLDLYYKVGFHLYIDNHEQYPQFMGKSREEIVGTASVDPEVTVPLGQPLLRVVQ